VIRADSGLRVFENTIEPIRSTLSTALLKEKSFAVKVAEALGKRIRSRPFSVSLAST
jgi:hypothetical protein